MVGDRAAPNLSQTRLECFHGDSSPVLTLRRGRSHGNGRHGHVVDYRHVIHSLRRKPMALLNLVYRDALFPRPAYRLAWERLIAAGDARIACRTMVALLALAHERGCEAELAAALTEQMQQEPEGASATAFAIDVPALRVRFTPTPALMPDIVVNLPPVAGYDALLPLLGVAA